MEVHQHPAPQLRRRRFAILFVALLAAACGSTDERPLASLRAMEETSLAYPGSTQLGRFALDQQTGSITGPQTAMFGYQFGTDASKADVEAFYEAELARRGWTIARSYAAITVGIPGSTESSARAWERGDRVLRLSFRRRDEQGRLDAATLARFATVYESVLFLIIPDRSAPTQPEPT